MDDIGALSIVVQGPLDAARIDAVANNCAHWRGLFPSAQLICAVSRDDGGKPMSSLGDSAAARAIEACCDLIVLAPAAQALPPIKTDSPGDNHVNLMIAAARAGLASATGRHVLRIRNDLTLADRAFLSAFAAERNLPRGDRAVFEERVLVPEIFTLNPLTLSRMPFHVSDWFHFGLLRDVRAIWEAAEPVEVADASFYATEPHLLGSNAVERRFLVRRASEQCVHFPVFRRTFPGLTLDRHNDLTDVETSLFVLADNFVLANLADCGAILPKYQQIIDRMSAYTRLECLSQSQLRARAVQRDVLASALFADEIRQARAYEAWPARTWRAARRLRQGPLYRCWRRLRAGTLRQVSGR